MSLPVEPNEAIPRFAGSDRRACYLGAGTAFVDGGVGVVGSDFSQPTSTRDTATVRSAISLIVWI